MNLKSTLKLERLWILLESVLKSRYALGSIIINTYHFLITWSLFTLLKLYLMFFMMLQEAIFRVVAAILHLGNVEFAEGDDGESSKPKDEKSLFHLKTAAELFMYAVFGFLLETLECVHLSHKSLKFGLVGVTRKHLKIHCANVLLWLVMRT